MKTIEIFKEYIKHHSVRWRRILLSELNYFCSGICDECKINSKCSILPKFTDKELEELKNEYLEYFL